jgi:hypothetical protein
MPDNPASIAAKLSARERAALNQLPRIGGNNPGREFTALLDLGLADCTIKGPEDGERWLVTPRPLGLAVRSILSAPEPSNSTDNPSRSTDMGRGR